jgi:hypothetical protein
MDKDNRTLECLANLRRRASLLDEANNSDWYGKITEEYITAIEGLQDGNLTEIQRAELSITYKEAEEKMLKLWR